MPKTLPPEIIRTIVLYLKNDKKSLYSCLLVSRDWCRGMVDLLWRQPFHLLYTCNKINSSTCKCSEKKRRSQAANLLTTYYSIKYNDELVKEGIVKTKGGNVINVMFNYLEFLSILDLRDLYFAIQDWTQWNKTRRSPLLKFLNRKFTSLTFNCNMFKYFFINSPKLKLLSFDTEFTLHQINNNNHCSYLIEENSENNNWEYYNILNDLLSIINESETKQFFANLTELVFTAEERKTKILSSLSRVCHNIQKLIIKVKFTVFIDNYGTALVRETNNTLEEAKQLVSLIRSQHNLVYFELFDTHEEGTSEILKSLKETQQNSLKTLILNNLFISDNNTILFHLKSLQNLQELGFNKFIYQQKGKLVHCWEDLWLPNLRYLELDHIDEHKEYSEELSSILRECSPLLNKVKN
ncbi:hypothetical protein C1645_736569 [Glomus cerebriforme]|uniref:F-box domain-containing protein n=1 Tax=Glomus cerebriforme TaxID=658196 RepID=A0A397T2X4_9GLOM|nr:hypothetical protein C1645_736569 [Glomus cerebriforme]